MEIHAALLLLGLFGTSVALPVQIGILASNSNEVLRLNGLTLAALGQAQAASLLPQLVLQQQQQPDVLLTPQLVNLNPQLSGPFNPQGPQLFFPNQAHQLTPMMVPNGQPDQLGPPPDPNNPNVAQQGLNPVQQGLNPVQQGLNPVQMFPQYQYPFSGYPQFPAQQGFPYFFSPYGFPQQMNPVMPQFNNAQQALERSTQRPQLPLQQSSQPKAQTEQTWPQGTQRESTTAAPELRGDASGPGIDEGHPNFPFLFEP